jgi:hypothetical protein
MSRQARSHKRLMPTTHNTQTLAKRRLASPALGEPMRSAWMVRVK